MDDALEKWTRRRVHASRAKHTTGDCYVCPNCHEPVVLRAGGYRAAHFAHKRGTGDRDCELYVQSLYQASSIAAAHQSHDVRSGEIKLGLRLYPLARPMSWGLELDLGVQDVSTGCVLLNVGGRETEVDLTANRQAHRTVTADPQTPPYRVLAVTPHASSASVFRDKHCIGLASKGPTVFTATGRAGQSLHYRAATIQGGRTYALVWKSDEDFTFPEELESEALESRTGFSAALVFVPRTPSQACKEWIVRDIGLQIGPSVTNIVPVWPPVINRITNSSIQATQKPAVILGRDVMGSADASAMFVRYDGGERGVQGRVGDQNFFRYEPGGKQAARFLTQGENSAQLDADFSWNPVDLWRGAETVVTLVSLRADGRREAVALHDRRAAETIRAIRRKELGFDHIAVPLDAEGMARSARNGEPDIVRTLVPTRERAPFCKNAFLLPEPDATWLFNVLCDQRGDLVLNFAALGFVSVSAIVASAADTVAAKLPDDLRNLLRKYLFQFSPVPRWPPPNMRMSDDELVRTFRDGQRLGASSAVRRVLENRLARFYDGVTP